MTHNRFFNHCLICAFILITGLGLAIVVPLLANSQGLATSNEIGAKDNAPEATRFYVAKTGNNTTGDNWANAFTNLQGALGTASSGDEIWVATGVYTPGTNKTDTFSLVSGVVLYGGFAATETLITEQDWENNPTVLSGDIDGNDTNTEGVVMKASHIVGNNAYNVITAKNVGNSAVLDGFTITAGQADDSSTLIPPSNKGMGGGFYCDGSGSGKKCNPSLKNITFIGNYAQSGGGAMYNNGWADGTSSPKLENVYFYSNHSMSNGGALANNSGWDESTSNPSLTNVMFSGNSASSGGAIYNYTNGGTLSFELRNVVFSGNSAREGGAMYSTVIGGAITPVLTNVTFSGNTAVRDGGGLYNEVWSSPGGCGGTCSLELRNSILWKNKDKSGIGTKNANIYNSTVCNASVTLKHSLAQGTGGSSSWTSDTRFVDGGGNIDANPMFVTPVNPSSSPNTDGNLRLLGTSPAINSGKNDFVTVATDLDGNKRIMGKNVDMGAFETFSQSLLPLMIR